MSTVVLTLGKVNFLKNKLISETFCLFGFGKFEIKQRFSAYQDQVCAWFMHLSMSSRDFDRSLWPGGRGFALSCCPGGRDI